MKSGKRISTISHGKKSSTKLNSNIFPIVGIGASAGGLEALEQFFENMPSNNGMAFVVIQHLDPKYPGILPELLQRITPMKVQQVTDLLKVKPDCVYVIPPNKSLSILNGALHLFAPVETHGLRLPIDTFLRSLADDRHEKSVAIILSGMGSDGFLGVKAIKEKNGTVLVQEPSTAKFNGMPNSVIEAVFPDIIAPANELAIKLVDYMKFVPSIKISRELNNKHKSNIDKIIILLRQQTGHDFSLYKKTTLFRRIERRKGIHQLDKIQNYVRFLQENPKETEILFKELLIGVTSFFRDTIVWQTLRNDILPALINQMPDGKVMRAWVAACSTGEEAYSLAIVFKEALEKVKKYKNISLQIFATDLDQDSIDKARKGVFHPNIIADVSSERLNRFFIKEAHGYRVNNAIREMIVFAPHDIIKDPPFTKLNILTCRNMLIYMEPELQNKLISMFNYSLLPNGILTIGTAESLGTKKLGFIEIDNKLKIYKRTANIDSPALIDFPSTFNRQKIKSNQKKAPMKIVDNIQNIADQILLQRFSPASVLVNDKGDIIYITGRTGKYLEPVAGKANWNIFAMAREGLREELPGAFRKAMQNFDPVIVHNIKVEDNGEIQFIDLKIQRIEAPDAIKGMIMLVFTDISAPAKLQATISKSGKRGSTLAMKELENELQRNHEELQITREEMQTSQEELKSTNEELQSTNEELQSTNEELQSANEELQSTNEELITSKDEMKRLNEELHTVNLELQSKVSDFTLASSDMKNLLNSTEIGILFLDKNLNIRRFTNPITKIFKIRCTDIGRPFTELVSVLKYPHIDNHALQVLKTLIPIETSIATDNGNWFTIRILPYRTVDDRIDGLVITFNDITVAKKLEIELKKASIEIQNLGKVNRKK